MSKRARRDWRKDDPEAAQEGRRYAHPLPSRSYLLELLGELGRPLGERELASLLGMSREEQSALGNRLAAMVRDGQLLRDRRGGYGLAERMDLVRGRVSGHADGFGFLLPEDGGDD
ncbi:MAG TPA: ribonuclease R, partial [Gammaproteobacteria bacterium]